MLRSNVQKVAKESRVKGHPRIDTEKHSFTVREMEIDDIAEVYQLGESNFKANLWPMLYRSWDEYEVTTLFNTDGDYCLVAENDDYEPGSKDPRIVGFVLGTVISKSGSAWSYGYVIWACTYTPWARAGIAGRLLDKLIEAMIEHEGIRIIMADTDPENEPAVKFFTKKGFLEQKPHVYLSTNLETNPRYAHLIEKSRQANRLKHAKRKSKPAARSKKRIK